MRMLKPVSASEAKTKFYELLAQMREGQLIQVKRHSHLETVIMGMEQYQ
ncbi:MAG: type II toxin-antitoxin system Phd/YefM family antitoxin [Dehalococcoidia bacterium]|nr:type II toxin-antitoxin system Phd/YefM family antitoxin [Dehalococcoidia bacterium]